MRIEHFRFEFNQVNGFYLKDKWILFRKPLELWNEETDENLYFKSLDEVLAYELEGELIKDIIERTEELNIPSFTGGRGASNGSNGTFSFGNAGGLDKIDRSKQLFPAYANTRIKNKTFEGAMSEFKSRFQNANKEWAYEVDDMGYVHQFVSGNKHSVNIGNKSKNTIILHNHPGGGHFSDADLISTSMQRSSKGIVASTKTYNYVFQKGTHFKANSFIKAVKTAKMKGKDYDDAVDKWLSKNARKYGYKYYKTK